MLQQVGLEAMGSALEDAAAPSEASRVVLASMATLIQTRTHRHLLGIRSVDIQLCAAGWTSKILSSGGMRFLHSLFERRNDPDEVQRLILRCVANLAMDRTLAVCYMHKLIYCLVSP